MTTRRGLFAAAGVGALAAAGCGDGPAPTSDVVPFHGRRQAGITTAAQGRLHFAAFDLTADSAADLRDLLRAWTAAAERLTRGRTVAPDATNASQAVVASAPPDDTGEVADLPASRLTVTFGFGPSLFDGRFGLAARRPAALRELPPLPGDELDPERSGGDLCVQACADDPQVAFHAVRNLARLARGTAVMRWSQLGFGRTSTTTRDQSVPRNLMGFHDGTNNLRAEDAAQLAEHVWVREPGWLQGGTYLVARRIRMLIESWDRASLADQEQTIGRTKRAGTLLAELPPASHVRLARGREKLLRRGYSFTDGMDADLGQLDAGLFFISFQNDPAVFARVQRRLATDALNEYVTPNGSAVFAVPPGVRPGGYVGEGLV